jgi:D-tyrosyl-tRNA(Tyr) deacylase
MRAGGQIETMRALIQRVRRCSVTVGDSLAGSIGSGILVFLGVRQEDAASDAEYLASRTAALRIFEDNDGKMNLSVLDTRGSVLVVSQFTLYADTKKGNRPSYTEAAGPEHAEAMYEHYVKSLRTILGADRVSTGVFRAMMNVDLINDGPVTIMLESKPHPQK